MAGYTPLFPEIVSSSIWNEDPATCKVWVTLMALADSQGNVYGSPAGMAPLARLSIGACKAAIAILTSPDSESRSLEHEGRRLLPIEGGWHLVNHKKYRDKAKSRAEYIKQWRAKRKEKSGAKQNETLCNIVKHLVTPCYQVEPTQTQTQTQTQTDVFKETHSQQSYTIEQVKDACILLGIPEIYAQSYFDQYSSQGWKKGNNQPITELRGHMKKRWMGKGWDFDEKMKGKEIQKDLNPPVVRDAEGKTPADRARERIEALRRAADGE